MNMDDALGPCTEAFKRTRTHTPAATTRNAETERQAAGDRRGEARRPALGLGAPSRSVGSLPGPPVWTSGRALRPPDRLGAPRGLDEAAVSPRPRRGARTKGGGVRSHRSERDGAGRAPRNRV